MEVGGISMFHCGKNYSQVFFNSRINDKLEQRIVIANQVLLLYLSSDVGLSCLPHERCGVCPVKNVDICT